MSSNVSYTMAAVCHNQHLSEELVVELVSWGIAVPSGTQRDSWRFDEINYNRIARAARLGRDLNINIPGAALALHLIEELRQLRENIREAEETGSVSAFVTTET